ncbi:MAG: hypothetical protein A3G87_02565 [Omnitrophica bacterium RIFCSPLOWO2_12_FULL_50_11]|nr:MAG: hypothetical protein A3G87_02565 [Omnitrophica bacterium RIFCSPLOWO2_12_FULL_50_11]
MKLKHLFHSFLLAILTELLLTGFFETTSGLTKKGNEHFVNKRYESALEIYRKAQVRDPERPEIRYNLGTSLYQLDQFQEAQSQLEQTLSKAQTKELKGRAWYNYGNTQYRLGQYDAAIDAYRKTVDLNPKDEDAKYNLEFLQKKKAIFEKKQDQRDQETKGQQQKQQQRQQQPSQGQGDQGQQWGEAQQGPQEKDQPQPSRPVEEKAGEQTGEQPDQGEEKQERQEIEPGSDQPQPEPKGEEREEPLRPGQAGREEDQPEPNEKGVTGPALQLRQGQMSQQDAMRILNALRESEQELQFLRQPTRQSEREPDKDW